MIKKMNPEDFAKKITDEELGKLNVEVGKSVVGKEKNKKKSIENSQNKKNTMKIEQTQQVSKVENKKAKKESAKDMLNSKSPEEIVNILKQDPVNVGKNLAEASESLSDVNKKVASAESALKASAQNVGDKNAMTQESLEKLLKKQKSLTKEKDVLEAQKETVDRQKEILSFLHEKAGIDVKSKEEELEEMHSEISKMNEELSGNKNHESKKTFTAGDVATNENSALVKKRDALKKDIEQVDSVLDQGKKAQDILKKAGIALEKAQSKEEDKDIPKTEKGEFPETMTEKEKKEFDEEFARKAFEKKFINVSSEDLQQQLLTLNKIRNELLLAGPEKKKEFQENEAKMREIRSELEVRGDENSTLKLNKKDSLEDLKDIDDLGDQELADKFEREKADEKNSKGEEGKIEKTEKKDSWPEESKIYKLASKLEEYNQQIENTTDKITKKELLPMADALNKQLEILEGKTGLSRDEIMEKYEGMAENLKSGQEESFEDVDEAGEQELVDRFESEKKLGDKGVEALPEQVKAFQEQGEKLEKALGESRRNYTKLHYKTEGIINKIRNMLGNVNTGKDQDVAGREEMYKKTLDDYRNFKVEEIKMLSGEVQEKAIAELEAFDAREHVNLYNDRTEAKAETFAGKLGILGSKLVQGYKKLPTGVKIGLAGALFAGGLATGTGVAASLIGTATMGKRALGAGAMGMGITGWREAKAHEKEQEKIRIKLEELQNGLSVEERIAQLSGFDDKSFDKLNKEFKGKIAGRSRRVLLGIGTFAGAMAVGEVGKVFGMGADVEGVNNPVEKPTPNFVNEPVLESKPTESMLRAAGAIDDTGSSGVEIPKNPYVGNGEGVFRFNNDSIITQDTIEEMIKSPEDQRNIMEKYLVQLKKEGVGSAGKSINELLQETNPEQIARVVGEPDATKVVEDIKAVFEVPDDWDSHDVHNFPKDAAIGGTVNKELLEARTMEAFKDIKLDVNIPESPDAVLGSAENLTDAEVLERNDIYTSVRNAVKAVEQQKIELAQWQADHSGGTVNEELLKLRTMEAFEETKLNVDIPENPDAVLGNTENLTDTEISERNDIYRSFRDAAKAAEQQKIEIAQWQADHSGGTVNKELLKAKVMEAFGGTKLDVEIPELPDMESVAGVFDGIEMVKDGIGTLTIEKGSSIEGALVKFLAANSEKLTDGGMGWDPDDARWGGSVEKWAGARAHGLVEEYAKINEGIDLDTVQPGTTLELNLSNPADIEVDVEFEGGPHIIPENEKIVFDNTSGGSEPEVLGEEGVVEAKQSVDGGTVVNEGNSSGQEKIINAEQIVQSQYPGIGGDQTVESVINAKSSAELSNDIGKNVEKFGDIAIPQDEEIINQYSARMESLEATSENTAPSPESEVSFDFNALSLDESNLFVQQMKDMFESSYSSGMSFGEILNQPAYSMGSLEGDFAESFFEFEDNAKEVLSYNERTEDYLKTRGNETVKDFYMRLAQIAKEKGMFEEVFNYSK